MSNSNNSSSPALFEELEPRLLLSADSLGGLDALVSSDEPEPGDATVLPAHQEFSPLQAGPATPVSSASADLRHELVFVDGGIEDYEALVAGFLGADSEQRRIQVMVLDADRDGIEQITSALAGQTGLDAMHLVSHGDDASLRLGNTTLDGESLERYREAIAGWAGALDSEADLLLYGCNLAASEDGRTLISTLAVLTSADVASSDDLTGSAILGGDWALEFTAGAIETKVGPSAAAQLQWSGVLAAPADIAVVGTTRGGLSLNEDGGNDAYFVADSGLTSTLSQFTLEVQFTATSPSDTTPFVSYNTASGDELSVNTVAGTNALELDFGTGADARSTAIDYDAALLDGQRHTLSTTWDNAAGDWQIFIDGVLIDSGTGLSAGTTLQTGGTLIFGQEQDSVGGGFDATQYFSGTLYDARLFDDVRSAAEINANHHRTVAYDEANLVANWRFDDLSVDGVVTEAVAGNNLSLAHASGAGFSASTPVLTLAVSEAAATGTSVGRVSGTDADREALITSLLAADPDLVYSAEIGKFYKLVNTKLDWDVASTTAQATALNAVNGQLASIQSAAEQEILGNLSAAFGSSAWVGATDQTTEGEWRWVDGGAQASQFWQGDWTGDNVDDAYANWEAGQPDNAGATQHYLTLQADGAWNDGEINKADVLGYLVEWDADEVLDATDALLYSIQSQTVAGAFTVDSDSGTITVADGSLLDYASNASHTLTVRVTDSTGGTHDEAFTISLSSASSLWLTTEDDVGSPSGASGLDSWTGGEVLSFDDPAFNPGSTSGTLNRVFNLDDFVQDGDTRVDSIHYVGTDMTVGSNAIQLRQGDVLLSSVFAETLVNSDTSTLAVTSRDVFVYRPDSLADYSLGGSFIKLINGADLSIETEGITLVESSTTIGVGGGATTVNAGDFLLTDRDNPGLIYRLVPGVLAGAATNTGSLTVLADVRDVGVNQNIHGVELVEHDTVVGDRTLLAGQILVSLYADDTVAGTPVSRADIFILDVTTTGDTTIATADPFFSGGDIGFDSFQESPWGISLLSTASPYNDAPTFGATLDGTPSFIEDNPAVVLDADVIVSDVELDALNAGLGNYAGASLTLARNGAADAEDVMNFNDGNGITLVAGNLIKNSQVVASFDTTTALGELVITFTDVNGETPTSTDVVNILRQITYSNSSNTPPASTQIDWTFDDGNAGDQGIGGPLQVGGSTTVTITPTDDSIVVSTTGNTVLFTEDAGATTALFTAAMDTVETGDTVTQVILTLANVEAGDTLVFGATSVDLNTNAATGPDANGFTYTVSSAGASPVVTISHAGASDTLTNTMLNNLVFNNTANDYLSTAARTVTLTSVTDSGSGLTADGTVATVNVAPVVEITARETVDDDADGQIDHIRITTDQNLNDDFSGLVVNVDGYTVIGYVTNIGAGGANDNVFYAQLTESGAPDSGTTPTVTLTANTSLGDGAGNNIDVRWWDTDWQSRHQITFDNTNSAEHLIDFPVLLRLTPSDLDFDKVKAGGADIRFVDADGTPLDYEIESWDDTPGSESATVWVRVPQLDAGSNSDFIWIYHDNAGVSDAQNAAGVWNANHTGVWHLGEDVVDEQSVGTHSDSTGANDGTQSGNVESGGAIGDGQVFDGDNDFIDLGSSAGLTDIFSGGGTVSAWINPTSWGENGYGRIFDKSDSTIPSAGWALELSQSGQQLLFQQGFSGSIGSWFSDNVSISLGAWQQVTVTYDASSPTNVPLFYIDGVLVNRNVDATPTGTMAGDAGLDLRLGNFSGATTRTFDGSIDEARISAGVRSADWIEASFLSQNGAFSFASFGAKESPGVVATDKAAAVLLSRETADLDSDGSIDALHLTFSEAVSDASVEASDFSVTVPAVTGLAFNPTANGDTADDTDIYLTFDDAVHDTGVTPSLAYMQSGGTDLEDLAAAPNKTANIASGVTADKAGPVLLSATAIDGGAAGLFDHTFDRLDLVFSESISAPPTEGDSETNFLFSGVDGDNLPTEVGGDTIISLGTTSVANDTISYTFSAGDTANVNPITPDSSTIDVNVGGLVADSIEDAAGNDLVDTGTGLPLTVTASNSPLVVATSGNTVLFTEDAGTTTALFTAAMDTVESGDTVTQVLLTLANVETGDTLVFGATLVDLNTNGASGPDANGFSYTVSSAGASPVVTISHAGATDTLTNTMLNSLVFNNTANNDPSTTARTVTLTSVTDSGTGLTADGTVATVNVAKADDPLLVSSTGNTVLFTEDAGATTALFAAAMDTVETGDIVTQVLLTLADVEAGDTLLFGATSVDLNTNAATGPDANGFTYTVSSAGASPVVTIGHAGTDDATVNAMLNSLVFNNTANNDPGTTARTVTLTSVTDSGSGLTADGTVATVNVAKADDPLSVSTTGNTVLFTEDGGATTALFTAAMDTVETGDTVTQVILTLANVEAGDALVFGATSVDLNTNGATGPDANGFTYTVSSAGATPVVTITHAGASDTLSNTMLNSLVFNNTANNDPSTTARTVTLTSVTDSGSGLTNDGTVATVNVAKADDPLAVSTTGNTVLFTEGGGATSALFAAAMDTVEVGDTVSQVILTLANVEAGDTLVFGATSIDLNTNAATGPDANGFTYTVSSAGASPVVTISHAGATDTLTNTMLNSLVFNNTSNNDPSTTARTVTLTSVTDSGSGLTNDGTVATVNVAVADDPFSVATTGNTVLFTEDAGATSALFAASMDTVETGDTVSQVILTLANVEAGDTLVFGATSVDLNINAATGPDANGFTYTVSSAGATPVVTISHAGATDTLTNTMLNSLVFNNTANNDPGTTARTVTLTSVTDSGSGLTNDGTVATVNVAKADDPLAVSTTGNTVLFTEGGGATSALFAAAMDTVEVGDTVSQIILTLNNVEAGDTLVFGATSIDLNTNAATGPDANGFTYTVSSAGATPVVTISHAGASDALTNAMLNSLAFNNTTNNDPSTTARTVTLTSVTDSGSGLTNDGTVATVNVAKADDPLSVSTTGNTVLFTEDAGATSALFAAAMDTVESGDTVTQVILTLANVEAGDTLVFGATSIDLNTNAATGPDANGFTYTVSSAGASPVVTISHAGATDTLTNTMLNSLVFNNTANNDPSTTARTVTLTSVTDSGSGLTNDGTVATVNVAKADDPLSVSTSGNTVLFTEDAGATTALFAATMDTVETGDTVTQVILTLANVEAGDNLTFGATSVDLNTNGPTGPDANGFTYTVSSAGATPVVTITHAGATDTLTNTMLNSLVFNNTANNDPSATARTVTLTSVTDSGSGFTADGTVATVNVAKADDPLAVSTTGNTVLFTEDAGASSALFAAAMDTVESGDTVTQVILTLANVEAGDTLVFGAISVDLNTNGATGPDANGFTYTVSSAGATPVVTISHAGASDTLSNTMLNSLVFNNTSNDDPSTTARTVTLTSVTDSGSGLTAGGTLATVSVAKADDPLSVSTTGNTVLFTEDAGATSALFAATMDTVETGDTISQVVLTLANAEAGDTLTFGATSVDLNTNAATGPDANGFTYTVSSAGATPVVTITHAGATGTLSNTMLNSLVFNNTSNNDPGTTARTVTLTSVTDSGSGLTNDGTVATVNVAKADDPLLVSTTGNTVLFTEDAGATGALFAAAMDTVEAGDTVSQVVLTLANVEAGDTLTFGATSVDLNTNAATGPDANGFTYTVSSAGATPVVTITHAGAADTLSNTMLNSLVFNNTSNNDPSTTARTVTLTSVTDSGSGLTNDGTVATVNVAKSNDAPTVSLINVVTSLPETTSTATAIKVADIVVADVDAGTNNLTLGGADLAHFEIVGTELRLKAGTSLDFEIPTDAGANHIFDVTVVVDDPGAGGTPDDTAATTLTVTDVNENPSGTGTLTTTSLNDDAGATNLFGGLTVSDPDTGENDLSVTITLTNPAAGVIGGGFTDLGGGVYRSTGLTVAQADSALDNATFTPTDGTGPSGTFTTGITLTVNDQGGGGEQSVLSATTVTITRVNTAPSGLPVIEGAPVETLVLTATTDDISDADGLGAFGFQWFRDGVPIATATDSSYTLVGEDRGTNIAVRVEFIDGNGATERVTSIAVGPVSDKPAPEPEPESEGLPPAADTPEEVETPPPLDEVELSAVLPVTEDLLVAGDAQPTQETPTGKPLSFEPQFLSQITQLLDAAAAGSVTSAGVGDRPAPLVDAQFLLRDRTFEPMATEMRPISDASYESSARQALIAGVQDMQNTMTASGDSRIEAEEFRQNVIQGTLGTLSVGSVTWLLRAGSLLASVFSSIPMWSTMDPLPVLDVSAKERKRRLQASSDAGGDDASEQRMDEILEGTDKRSNSRDTAS